MSNQSTLLTVQSVEPGVNYGIVFFILLCPMQLCCQNSMLHDGLLASTLTLDYNLQI